MKDSKTWEFTWLEHLYEEYSPNTPYGKQLKKERKLFVDQEELLKEFDLNDKMIDFIDSHNQDVIHILGALKRIPRLERFSRLDTGDIFLVKKFIFNYKKIRNLIDSRLIETFGFSTRLDELFQQISLDGKEETFSISELYEHSLKDVREKIREIDIKIKDSKKQTHKRILKECSLDLRFKDFVLVSDKNIKDIRKRDDLYIEPYDNNNFVVKAVYDDDFIKLNTIRDNHYKEEKKIEGKVRKRLSDIITGYKKDIIDAISTISRLDVVLARAILIKKHSLKRPNFIKDKNIKIKEGNLIPLKDWLKKEGLKYQPLSIDISERVSIIRGSNMGGKTILLKTIGFLQLLTQLGLYVPCKEFNTNVFSKIVYIGETREKNINGLSSFGLEMNLLMETLNSTQDNVLFLIDEFARTTNSAEASALISALSWYIRNKTNSTALISTHFTNITRNDGISFYRMKGLDIDNFENTFNKNSDKQDLQTRLRLINKFMDYTPLKEEKIEKVEDALKVAKLLGVNNIIIDKANEYLRR